ncbi:hypothetical protein B0H11DRAFT_2300082 [Mycena galericulata]|nr:hypothetical protein B0H11DRAFT_2300082 [Mycena galericulata]
MDATHRIQPYASQYPVLVQITGRADPTTPQFMWTAMKALDDPQTKVEWTAIRGAMLIVPNALKVVKQGKTKFLITALNSSGERIDMPTLSLAIGEHEAVFSFEGGGEIVEICTVTVPGRASREEAVLSLPEGKKFHLVAETSMDNTKGYKIWDDGVKPEQGRHQDSAGYTIRPSENVPTHLYVRKEHAARWLALAFGIIGAELLEPHLVHGVVRNWLTSS